MNPATRHLSAPACAPTGSATVYPILFMVSTAHLLNDMMQSVIPAVYPLLKDNFGFTFTQIGIITLVFQMTSSLLQPLMGRYADLHPRPYSLAVGMCFTLTGLLTLATAHGFLSILLAVALIGWGSSVFHPESSRVAQLASGGRKGLAQSIFQVGGNAGSAMGPLLAALIVIPFGQTSIGWFALAALLAILLLKRIGDWYKGELAAAPYRTAATASRPYELPKRKVRTAMVILTVLVFSKYFYIACMTNYFTFFLMDKFAVSVQNAQYCLFGFLAASAAGTVIGGPLGDRFGRKYVIWGSILGAAPFALLLPYANLSGTIALAVIIGFVISSAFSAILVYATDLMPGKVGLVSGIFFGLMFGLGGIGSAFFGWLADRTNIEFIFRVSTLLPLRHHRLPAEHRKETQTMNKTQTNKTAMTKTDFTPTTPPLARPVHYTCRYQSPLGGITIAADSEGLTGLWFDGQKYFAATLSPACESRPLPLFEETRRWLDLYFSGKNPGYLPPLHLTGTPFRMAVWEILCSIPYGQTVTYGEIARKVARQNGKTALSAQAVGNAVGHNPVSIIVPCHRVIGSNGSLTGYAGGIARKTALLTLEQADLTGTFVPRKGTAL